ncbi:unnamed protein product, partial [Iphiclides podalirius]
MYVAFALAALFSAATCVSEDRFTGQWLPMVTFPNVVTNQIICDKYNVSVVKTDPCQCGNLSATIFEFEKGVTDTPARSVTMPVIVVESIQEVEPALVVRCECGGEYVRHALFRTVDNYYVMYEKHPQNVYGPEEPNTANLLVKKAPTSSELREVLASIPDLKHRSTGIMCDPDKNVGL